MRLLLPQACLYWVFAMSLVHSRRSVRGRLQLLCTHQQPVALRTCAVRTRKACTFTPGPLLLTELGEPPELSRAWPAAISCMGTARTGAACLLSSAAGLSAESVLAAVLLGVPPGTAGAEFASSSACRTCRVLAACLSCAAVQRLGTAEAQACEFAPPVACRAVHAAGVQTGCSSACSDLWQLACTSSSLSAA